MKIDVFPPKPVIVLTLSDSEWHDLRILASIPDEAIRIAIQAIPLREGRCTDDLYGLLNAIRSA